MMKLSQQNNLRLQPPLPGAPEPPKIEFPDLFGNMSKPKEGKP